MNNDRFKFRVWDDERKKYRDDLNMSPDHQSFAWEHMPERCIVEQCTGLKDKNGCLIYEGDIVRFFWYPGYHVYPVEWDNEPGRFLYCGHNREINDSFHSGMGEVIGNIHEMDLKKAQRVAVKHKTEPDWNPAWMNEDAK